MLRMFVRVSAGVGLAALALVMAASALAGSDGRAGGSQSIGAEQIPQAVTIAPNFTVVMSPVVSGGLTQPVGMANAGDGSGRLFVVQQSGYIRIIKNGNLLSTPYLTLTNKVLCCGERGLLSIAFDPSYITNGIFYVYYTALNGDVTIERYVSANPASDVANISSSTPILTVTHPAVNHNGGQLQFGPDGYLYAGLGDGGGSNDDDHGPIGNGQDPTTLLGKILRLNVRGVATYTVPASNPFTRTVGYSPEIWSLGVRNPWRFSFDRATGDLYVGDVGQNCWEEIDYQPASSHGGENYGWRLEEGPYVFDPNAASNCSQPLSTLITTTKPITAYNHALGSAVTGGYVYRGQQYPWMRGVYIYSDSGSGRIWAVQQISPGVWSGSQKIDTPYGVTAFGEDENGELYLADYSQGAIYKITSPSPSDLATSSKSVSARTAPAGSTVTYTIVVRNTGLAFYEAVRVTDTVPGGLNYLAGSLTSASGTPDDSAAPMLKWAGTLSGMSAVTLTYAVTVATSSSAWLVNNAVIDPGSATPFTRTSSIIVNPREMFLPLIRRNT